MTKIQQPFRILLLFALASLLAIAATLHLPSWSQDSPPAAIAVEAVPNPRAEYGGWVSDTADLLSPETETELNRIIDELEAANGAEVAVVTIESAAAEPSPKAFATQLFNDWGIGKAAVDNGVLVLLSEGDRRVEIETGDGLPVSLPDALVKTIIDNQMLPQFKQGNFDAGVLNGTRAVVETLAGRAPAIAPTPTPPPVVPAPAPPVSSAAPSFSGQIGFGQPFSHGAQQFLFLSSAAAALLSFGLFKTAKASGPSKTVALGGRSRVKHSDSGRRRGQLLAYGTAFCLAIALLLWLSLASNQGYALMILVTLSCLGFYALRAIARYSQQANKNWRNQWRQNNAVYMTFYTLVVIVFWVCVAPILFFVLFFIGIVTWLLVAAIGSSLITLFGESLSMLVFVAIAAAAASKPIADLLQHRLSRYQPQFYAGQPPVRLESVADGDVMPHLSDAERMAAKLGSVKFQGWRLPGQLGSGALHIRAIEQRGHGYRWCDPCQEWLVEVTQTIAAPPTYLREGSRKITERCLCCQAEQSHYRTIPKRRRSASSSSRSYSGSSYSGYSGGSSGGGSSSSGSSSSGGSFGGGSSSGGGDGGSW